MAYTISTYLQKFNNFLKQHKFQNIWISGEVSQINHYPTASYFTLKDEFAVVNCIYFQSPKLDYYPKEGDAILIQAYPGVYEKNGRFTLKVIACKQDGKGNLYELFLKTKEQLQKEGLFDQSRKSPLPKYPKTIGLLTSESGAVYHDFIRNLHARWPSTKVLFRSIRVQGEGAYLDIIQGLEELQERTELEVIVIARGGGSLEELWNFNEEELARFVAQYPIPIVSAIGHETDFTLLDFVADKRAATPTEAALHAVPDKHQEKEKIATIQQQLTESVHLLIAQHVEKIELQEDKLSLAFKNILQLQENKIEYYSKNISDLISAKIEKEQQKLLQYKERIQELSIGRIEKGKESLQLQSSELSDLIHGKLKEENQSISIFESELEALNPLRLLKEGMAFVSNKQKEVISSKSSAIKEKELNLHFKDGSLNVTPIKKSDH